MSRMIGIRPRSLLQELLSRSSKANKRHAGDSGCNLNVWIPERLLLVLLLLLSPMLRVTMLVM
jgi:hypothetical protein